MKKRILRLLASTILVPATLLYSPSASADEILINLEWRPTPQTVFVGDPVNIGLYAVVDEGQQSLRGIDMVFTWDPTYLGLLGLDQAGAVDLQSSEFPSNDPYNLNEVVPPQDGDGYYRAWANLGESVEVTPEGVLLTTFQFEALAVTPETLVVIEASGGDPFVLETKVIGGSQPGMIVTGTLGDATVTTFCMSCVGDVDNDGDIDLSDLAELLAHYGTTSGATPADGDVDCDGDVDLSDLAALLAVYGTTCE